MPSKDGLEGLTFIFLLLVGSVGSGEVFTGGLRSWGGSARVGLTGAGSSCLGGAEDLRDSSSLTLGGLADVEVIGFFGADGAFGGCGRIGGRGAVRLGEALSDCFPPEPEGTCLW